MTLILLTFKSRHLKEKVQTSLYCRLATDQGFIRGVYLCLCYYYFFQNQIYNYGMVTDHVDTFRHLVQKIAEFLFGDFLWSTMNKKPTTIDFFCFGETPTRPEFSGPGVEKCQHGHFLIAESDQPTSISCLP